MSCSRTQHGDGRSRTPDLSLRSPTLYHWATARPFFNRAWVWTQILKDRWSFIKSPAKYLVSLMWTTNDNNLKLLHNEIISLWIKTITMFSHSKTPVSGNFSNIFRLWFVWTSTESAWPEKRQRHPKKNDRLLKHSIWCKVTFGFKYIYLRYLIREKLDRTNYCVIV